ncbi:hypothetical protein [Actinoplanes sp. NPDC051411]|uniref:hypothetical protein n=1 Tax=Actinoplanes sp. NPDC051411 TaxID=3155522 RepID=UPI0034242993
MKEPARDAVSFVVAAPGGRVPAEIVAALDGSCDVVLPPSKSPPEGLREVARALVKGV